MKCIRSILLAALLACGFSGAYANTEQGYVHTIEGVGFWTNDSLSVDGTGAVLAYVSYRDYPEFAAYCDGKNRLFVYEKSSQPFACQTIAWDGAEVADMMALRRLINGARSRPPTEKSMYLVALRNLTMDSSERVLTVSKTRLPHGNWHQLTLSEEDRAQSIDIASGREKQIARNEYYQYKSLLRHSDAKVRKIAGRGQDSISSIKIRSGNLEVILLPTLYQFDQGSGNLISTVIVHDREGYRFVGHVEGCVMSVGADLDGDGLPEVIVQNCDSDFHKRVDYMKLYPTIKSLMSFDAS